MIVTADEIAKALGAKRSGSGWSAKCITHEDTNPSLSIGDDGSGKPLLHCHAGCEQDAIIAELQARGLWRHNPEIPAAHMELGEYHQSWDYHDAAGNHVQRICRWDLPSGKTIRPLSYIENRWQWKALPDPRPLYHLPKLLKSTGRVLVVEGEKAADAAQKMFPDEFVVTCWSGGAKAAAKTDWQPLAGRDVTLWPDADEPGKKSMQALAETLAQIGCTVRTLDLCALGDLPEAWDAADALADKSCDTDQIWQALKSAQALEPKRRENTNSASGKVIEKRRAPIARHISSILAKPSTVQWLIRDVIERFVIAVIAGKRGTFKSFVALHWAMQAAANGEPVLFISAEGAGFDRRIRAWAIHHGVDVSGFPVYAIERRMDLNSKEGMAFVQEDIQLLGIRPALIVVDTLSKNSGNFDENSNTEAKALIGVIDTNLRQPYGATVLLVAHTGHTDQARVRGASAIEADTDAAYIATKSDYTVSISRERFKDSPELQPLTYEARLINLGYQDEDGNEVQSFAMVSSEAPTIPKKGWGKNQHASIQAIKEWARANPAAQVIDSQSLGALLKAQGVTPKRKPEVLDSLCNAGILTPSIGGHSLNRGALP